MSPQQELIAILAVLAGSDSLITVRATTIGGRYYPEERIQPSQALQRAKSSEYHWKGSVKRIKWMELRAPRLQWVPCFRTLEAAVFAPWPGNV